jgi:6-phosphogluconolactonase
VLPNAEAATARAADVIAERLRTAVSAKSRFCLALSGGSTPIPMFEALAPKPLPWDQVEIYQVDERVAPGGSRKRNLTAIQAAFGRTRARIVAMPVESDDLVGAAARYEEALPRAFDLIQLGLGLDGHTASLYPGDPVLDIVDRDVALCGPRQGLSRMTLTYRGLSKATEIIWLITGATRSIPLRRLCDQDEEMPAARVACERTRIITDEHAADGLESYARKGVHLWHRDSRPLPTFPTGR